MDAKLKITAPEEFTHPKLRVKTSQSDRAREIDPPTDAETASVSQIYDAQEKLELVLQKGTEATLPVWANWRS